MSYQDAPTNRSGGNTLASYFGPIGAGAVANFGNFRIRYIAANGNIELATIAGNESVAVFSSAEWGGGILNYDGAPSAFNINVPLTTAFIPVGDPGVVIPHGEWRWYDISPVARTDGRWYRIYIMASNANNVVRITVESLGDLAGSPVRQSRAVPFANAQTASQITAGPLSFRYEQNSAGGHIQVASANGQARSGFWYTSFSNGIGFSGSTQIEGALDLNVPATGWTTLGGLAPVASTQRSVHMTIVGPTNLWEVVLANANNAGIILTVDQLA